MHSGEAILKSKKANEAPSATVCVMEPSMADSRPMTATSCSWLKMIEEVAIQPCTFGYFAMSRQYTMIASVQPTIVTTRSTMPGAKLSGHAMHCPYCMALWRAVLPNPKALQLCGGSPEHQGIAMHVSETAPGNGRRKLLFVKSSNVSDAGSSAGSVPAGPGEGAARE